MQSVPAAAKETIVRPQDPRLRWAGRVEFGNNQTVGGRASLVAMYQWPGVELSMSLLCNSTASGSAPTLWTLMSAAEEEMWSMRVDGRYSGSLAVNTSTISPFELPPLPRAECSGIPWPARGEITTHSA